LVAAADVGGRCDWGHRAVRGGSNGLFGQAFTLDVEVQRSAGRVDLDGSFGLDVFLEGLEVVDRHIG